MASDTPELQLLPHLPECVTVDRTILSPVKWIMKYKFLSTLERGDKFQIQTQGRTVATA